MKDISDVRVVISATEPPGIRHISTGEIQSRISAASRAFTAFGATMSTATGSFRNFAEAAVKFQKRQTELEIAAGSIRHLVDADGYVKLAALLEMAQQFGDPQMFLTTVENCVVSPHKCRCWWCKLKRFARRVTGETVLRLRRGKSG